MITPEDREETAKQFIESNTSTPFDATLTFAGNLKSGVRLCQSVNAVTSSLAHQSSPSASITPIKYSLIKSPFTYADNIHKFLNRMRLIGVSSTHLFDVVDLVEENNMHQVIDAIHALARHVETLGINSVDIDTQIDSSEQTSTTCIGDDPPCHALADTSHDSSSTHSPEDKSDTATNSTPSIDTEICATQVIVAHMIAEMEAMDTTYHDDDHHDMCCKDAVSAELLVELLDAQILDE